jgi:hypothetical protein
MIPPLFSTSPPLQLLQTDGFSTAVVSYPTIGLPTSYNVPADSPIYFTDVSMASSVLQACSLSPCWSCSFFFPDWRCRCGLEKELCFVLGSQVANALDYGATWDYWLIFHTWSWLSSTSIICLSDSFCAFAFQLFFSPLKLQFLFSYWRCRCGLEKELCLVLGSQVANPLEYGAAWDYRLILPDPGWVLLLSDVSLICSVFLPFRWIIIFVNCFHWNNFQSGLFSIFHRPCCFAVSTVNLDSNKYGAGQIIA